MDNLTESDNILGFGKKARAKRFLRRSSRGRKISKRLQKFSTSSKGSPVIRNIQKRRTALSGLRQTILGSAKPVTKKMERNLKKVARRLDKGLTVSKSLVKRASGEKTGVGKVLQAVSLAPLLPFKAVMIKALRGKGKYSSGMKFPAIIKEFYNSIVAKNSFDQLADNYFEDHPSAKIMINDDYDGEHDNVVTDLAQIVTAIVNFFKKKKKDKEEGKPMTTLEKELGQAAQIVEAKLIAENEDETPVTVGAQATQNKNLIKYGAIALGVAVIAFVAFKK